MTRVRILFAVGLLSLIVGVAPSHAQETSTPSNDGPVVVVDDGAAVPEDEAWTFRYLVPTVLAMSGAAILVTLVVYGVRIRGRYRVAR